MKVYFNEYFERRGSQKLKDMFATNRIELDEIKANPKQHVLCFRPSNLRLDFDGQLPSQSRLLYSYWHGYLKKQDWVDTQANVVQAEGDFLTAHTSGHIYVEDIQQFVSSLAPQNVIPIHTFERDSFGALFNYTLLLDDGRPYQVQ